MSKYNLFNQLLISFFRITSSSNHFNIPLNLLHTLNHNNEIIFIVYNNSCICIVVIFINFNYICRSEKKIILKENLKGYYITNQS